MTKLATIKIEGTVPSTEVRKLMEALEKGGFEVFFVTNFMGTSIAVKR